jgi:DNA modification methylase
MDRIIRASTNPGDLVADFFCGAGTTGIVARRLARRFILSDLQDRAIRTTRSRLVLTHQDAQEIGEPVYLQREGSLSPESFLSMEDLGEKPLDISGSSLSLPDDLASRVEYWEIDPDWKGGVFQSKYQAARPWRKGDLPATIVIPRRGEQVCLRIFLVSGERAQQVLK